MFDRPDILMIGSSGRNVGKTLLACEMIRRHAASYAVTAVKITTIHEEEWSCPHGADGCGVCGSFKGDYQLTEEHDGPPDKDTTRLLTAGAARVFWLRVRHEHLAEGVGELVRRLPVGQPVVIESNSARQVLAPGLFLVLRDGGAEVKASCRRVMGQADRTLIFDGGGWGVATERITFSAGRWWMRQEAAGIVLAGGQSRRMGQDKNFLPVAGRPMIQHIVAQVAPWVDEVLIGADDSGKFAFLQCRVVPDREVGMGPLMGLCSCLAASKHELNVVTACDIPMQDPHFLMRMIDAAQGNDIVMPLSQGGRPEPLLAVYRKSVGTVAEQVLSCGGRRMADLFTSVRVKYIGMDESGWYRNVNTMEDYRDAALALVSVPDKGMRVQA